MIEKVLERFENVVNSLGWDAIGGKENNDLYEWYLWLKEMVECTPYKQLRELLDAIHWDAFAEDDTTLEIDREVAERIRRGDY